MNVMEFASQASADSDRGTVGGLLFYRHHRAITSADQGHAPLAVGGLGP